MISRQSEPHWNSTQRLNTIPRQKDTANPEEERVNSHSK